MATITLPGRGRGEEPEWAVFATVAAALLIGLLLQNTVLGRMQTASAGGTTLSYPATWTKTIEEDALFAAADLKGGGIFGPRVAVRELPREDLLSDEAATFGGGGTVVEAATSWSILRGRELQGYRILGIDPTTLNGREAAHVEYAYLADGPLGAAGGAMPALMRAVDTLVASGDRYAVLTVAAERSDFERLTEGQFPRVRSLHQDLLQSWRVP